MKKFITSFLFALITVISFSQVSDATLTTQVNSTIRGKNYNPAAAADMHIAVIDGKVSLTDAETITGNKTFTGITVVGLVRNTQTSSYTLALSDNFKTVEMNSASATVLTVPLDGTVPFPVDRTQINIKGKGSGQVTITPISGVTINSFNNQYVLSGQSAYATLIKVGTNEWDLVGNLKP